MGPSENTFAVSLAIVELSLVGVSVLESFVALAVSAVVVPLALVDAAVLVDNDALALAFAFPELSLVDGVLVLLDSEELRLLHLLIVELVTFHRMLQQVVLVVRQILQLTVFVYTS